MTIQDVQQTGVGEWASQPGLVAWLSPAAGLWVATRAGEHEGRVERREGRYVAVDARGRAIGTFDELPRAFGAIDGSPEAGARRSDRRMIGIFIAINAVAAIMAGLLGFSLLA